MASERALKLGVVAGAAGLMALSVAADLLSPMPEPRRIVLCGLLAVVPASLLWQCLRRLAPRAPRMESAHSRHAVGVTANDDAMLSLEARLEHAPIALFRIDHASGT